MTSHQSHLARNYKRADSDVEKILRQIRKIKYPVLAIEPAQQLQTKISQFKNEKLQIQMKRKLIEEKNLNAYRKIRGDGNCFFRALAYSYLSSAINLGNVETTFYQLQDIQLTTCLPQSIPKEFKLFYNDKILKQALLSNWPVDVRHFTFLCKNNNKRILSRMFRKNPYLDFIVILYFRSLCLKGLAKHKEEVKDFMKGTQEQQIRTYGQQSQGVVLDICSRFMKVSIDVYEVRKEQLKHYSYKNEKLLKESLNVSLLYYENHYDILQQIESHLLTEQKNDTKIVEEQYYSKVNQHMIEGNCIQCNKDDYIYEDNFLCDNCFQISKSQMLNTVKADKWVRGLCRDCGRNGLKVLEMISLCEECVKRQSQVKQEDLKGTSPRKNREYCGKCHVQLNENHECPLCSSLEIGICLQCDRKTDIDRETKLCRGCKDLQKTVLKRQERRNDYLKNQCSNCKQPYTSSYHENRCLRKPKEICHYCNESKDSQLHQMKCVQKLTAGRIGAIPKTQKISLTQQMGQTYDTRRCRKCQLLCLNETLVGGWCKKCRQYFLAQDRHKNEQFFVSDKTMDQSDRLGSKISQQGQKCKMCKRIYYLHKIENGCCPACKSKVVSGVRF